MSLILDYWNRYRLTIIVAVVCVVAAGVTVVQSQPEHPPLEVKTAAEPTGELIVDIEGAVATPGVHRLPEGSLVEDAIAAAGGLTEHADTDRIARDLNRADQLKKNQKIYLAAVGDPETSKATTAAKPSASGAKGTASAASAGGESASESGGIVNINTAGLTELEALPGVGPATAQKILDHRESIGAFEAIEQLKDVPGIGDAKFAEMEGQVTV